jgi:DNA polymerase
MLSRQVRQHLESLRLAGVEWLPAADAPAETGRAHGEKEASKMAKPSPMADSLFERGESSVESEPQQGLDERRKALQVLAETVSQCQGCPELVACRTQTVFGVGPLDAEICFVGEAPGADEDARGEPFVGAAGQLLNRIIAACQLRREEVYICNIIKCRPPGNRVPLATEATNCRGFLEDQLRLVHPKAICALGSTAAQNLLGTTQSIGKLRGRFHEYKGIPVLCTYHPAFLLPHRSPEKKKEVWEDMKMLLKRIGHPIP